MPTNGGMILLQAVATDITFRFVSLQQVPEFATPAVCCTFFAPKFEIDEVQG